VGGFAGILKRGEPYLRKLVMEYDRKSLRYLHKDRDRER
jgi:hypothetical protein